MRLLSKVIKSDNAIEPISLGKTIQLSNEVFERSHDNGETFPADAVPILRKAEIDAKNIRKQAEIDAKRMHKEIETQMGQAKKEAEDAFQTSKHQGYKEGYELGKQEANQQYESLIKQAKQTIESAKKASQERIEQTEYDILHMATALAEKVIGSVLPQDDGKWLEMVKRAISEVKEQDEVRLLVHHKWFDFMMMHKKELKSLLRNTAEFYVYPEASLDEFSCIIEFPNGRIDAGVDSQLTELKRKLSAKLEEDFDGRNHLD